MGRTTRTRRRHDAGGDPRAPVVLVVSPHAGGAHGQSSAAELLRRAGVEVGEQLSVNELDGNNQQGNHWRDRGFRAAVAAGGDGTIGAVATQVAESGLPVGILPMGTSNDIARSYGVPLRLEEASAVIAAGAPVEVDAGQVIPAVTEPYALSVESAASPTHVVGATTSGAYFLHAMTLGLNVVFAQLATDVARRERWGPLNYATSAFEALTQFQPMAVTLRLRGVPLKRQSGNETRVEETAQTVECEVAQVAVVNAPVFGGALNLRLPSVALHDRLLDVVVFEALDPQRLRASFEGLITLVGQLKEHLSSDEPHGSAEAARRELSAALSDFALPGIHHRQAREVVIETAQAADVTLDGEIRAKTPALVRVAPHPVRLLLPVEHAHR